MLTGLSNVTISILSGVTGVSKISAIAIVVIVSNSNFVRKFILLGM